jgi:uncharacterized protein YceK
VVAYAGCRPSAALAAILLCGCATVREEQKPLAETTMMVTRAGDSTTMTWTAQPAVDYVIWYADRRDAQARWNWCCRAPNGCAARVR